MKTLFFLLLILSTFLFAQEISLKNSENQFDYVIITINDFLESCETFKDHKESFNDFSVLVTTKNKILSEFYGSSIDQENIRDFISFAGNNWKKPAPKYFLLAADVDSLPNFKFQSVNLLDYTDTSYSDYYYSVDTSSFDSNNVSFAVGRVAARNKTEIQNYFNKVINYELNSELQDWNNRALFVSDNEYGADSSVYYGNIFAKIAYDLSMELPEFIQKDFVIPIDTSKFYGDKDSIIIKLQRGQSSVFFSGHSNNEIFTHELIFTESDFKKISNVDKPYFISMFGKQEFARDTVNSIINIAILSEHGAISGIASVGIHFVSQSNEFFKKVWNNLYSDLSVGDIFVKTMNAEQSFSEKRKFNIFGDPSIILKSDFSTRLNEIESSVPKKHYLLQNYPNPFNPTTTIKYSVGTSNESEFVKVQLTVFDVLGRKIATLVNEDKSKGIYEVDFDASSLSSGIYFYSLSANGFNQTKKMILMQ